MKIKNAVFVKSSKDYKDCPPGNMPEFAFIGRSNVGKSTLINMLVNNSKLAKTSNKPGKTQLINHFLINQNWYLVDLPGYGWAKVSKKLKKEWSAMTREYLIQRANLTCVFVLIDVRLPPQQIDVDFINWLGNEQIPFSIVFTKADKQSDSKTNSSVSTFMNRLLETWEELPPHFVTSGVKNTGKKELLGYIHDVILSLQNR